MMKSYARIEDGIVQEIILPATYGEDDPSDSPSYKAGDEIPIERRYASEFVATLVDITGLERMPSWYWMYDGKNFQPYQPSKKTAAEILQANTQTRDALLIQASRAIAPLQYAVDLEDATDADVSRLKKWKQYSVAVNRVALDELDPTWPHPPV